MSDLEWLSRGTGPRAGPPTVGCQSPVRPHQPPHDRRNRASVLTCYDAGDSGRPRVLVATTPELRLQCATHDVHRVDAVVYTHAHADHIMGLDDCRRFNAVRGGPLDVWADARTHATLQRCFQYAFR